MVLPLTLISLWTRLVWHPLGYALGPPLLRLGLRTCLSRSVTCPLGILLLQEAPTVFLMPCICTAPRLSWRLCVRLLSSSLLHRCCCLWIDSFTRVLQFLVEIYAPLLTTFPTYSRTGCFSFILEASSSSSARGNILRVCFQRIWPCCQLMYPHCFILATIFLVHSSGSVALAVGYARCQFFRVLRLPLLLAAELTDAILGGMAPKPLFSDPTIMAAFDAAEGVQFPAEALKALLPDVWRHCQLVADSLSVPVSWVLLAEVCAAAFLAPTAVLYPAKTVPLHTMPWAFILHPGATQTSGLMAFYSKTRRQIEIWEHDHQVRVAHQAHRAALDAFHAAENGPNLVDGEPHAKKQKFNAPPPVHIGFTSGSVDGVIGRMAEPQNLSRAAAFLSEGLIFLSWISDQNAQHKGLVTQLTDRLVWDKVTVKARCSFCYRIYMHVRVTLAFLHVSSHLSFAPPCC